MFWVDKFVFEIKDLIIKRNAVLNERHELERRIKAGEAYFSKRIDSPNPKELENGIKNVLSIITQLRKKDNEIKDIDTVIVSELEAYLGNFIGKVRMPERLNEAGDLVKYNEVYAVPFNSDNPDLKEVTPNDIWFLKMIKEAFKATNVGFIEK